MTRFWITHNKDWNPKAGLILMGYANEQSAVLPGLGAVLGAHPKQGWVNVNQRIGTFKIEEGRTFPVLIRADVLEWGSGLDGQSDVGSDREPDESSQSEVIQLSCHAGAIPITEIDVNLQRARGGDAGRVALEFAAFQAACHC